MTNFLSNGLRHLRVLSVATAALCALVAPAMAAQCAPKEQIVQRLASDYREKPASMGVSASGVLTIIFASPAGTWTAVAVSASGSACILDVGDGWTDLTLPGVTAQAD